MQNNKQKIEKLLINKFKEDLINHFDIDKIQLEHFIGSDYFSQYFREEYANYHQEIDMYINFLDPFYKKIVILRFKKRLSQEHVADVVGYASKDTIRYHEQMAIKELLKYMGIIKE